MADALKLYIVRNNAIPGTNQWHIAISGQLGLGTNQITTTPRKYSRAYLIDTSGWLGTALASGTWAQPSTGTTFTAGARLMIVSTVGGPQLPAISPASFNTIWNIPLRASPWPTTTWAGRGEDLVIQRITLDPLFFRVILNPIDSGFSGSFAIETNGMPSTINPVPSAGGPLTSWFLQGTVLRLYDYNTGSANLETKAIVQADCSYVFENAAWRGQLSGLGTNGPFLNTNTYAAWVAATNFTAVTNQFQTYMIINPPLSVSFQDSTLEVVGTFYTFMNDYNSWAKRSFPTGWFNNPSASLNALTAD